MTETSPLGTVNSTLPHTFDGQSENQKFQQLTKQGHAVYGVEIKVVDEEGITLVKDGKQSGQLQVRGPWVVDEYYNLPGIGADKSGWFDTGDIATIDAHGYMKITDRKKDVIKSGGEWISSVDIENAITLHPEVGMAAVIGVYHPKWDERPLLVLERSDNSELSLEQAQQFLSDKIAKWWIPEALVYVDKLPMTATGKVYKVELKEKYSRFFNR
jgi:fatty-acyl-CoA synthase